MPSEPRREPEIRRQQHLVHWKTYVNRNFGGDEIPSTPDGWHHHIITAHNNSGFHAKHDWFFARLAGGGVRIRVFGQFDDRLEADYIEIEFAPNEWASIVGSVSASGDTAATFTDVMSRQVAPPEAGMMTEILTAEEIDDLTEQNRVGGIWGRHGERLLAEVSRLRAECERLKEELWTVSAATDLGGDPDGLSEHVAQIKLERDAFGASVTELSGELNAARAECERVRAQLQDERQYRAFDAQRRTR